jgi:hypothetical protein
MVTSEILVAPGDAKHLFDRTSVRPSAIHTYTARSKTLTMSWYHTILSLNRLPRESSNGQEESKLDARAHMVKAVPSVTVSGPKYIGVLNGPFRDIVFAPE